MEKFSKEIKKIAQDMFSIVQRWCHLKLMVQPSTNMDDKEWPPNYQ